METFYRKPHPELLPAAFMEIVRTADAATGPRSLAFAVFLSSLLGRMCAVKRDAEEVLQFFFTALRTARGGEGDVGADRRPLLDLQANEQLDTVLRAMWLSNQPHLDEVLADVTEDFLRDLRARLPEDGLGAATRKADLLALAQSVFPPEDQRNRTHILRWPLPSHNLTAFEKHIREAPFPLYGATRHWFAHTYTLHTLAKEGHRRQQQAGSSSSGARSGPAATATHDFAVLSPQLARDLTCGMVDAFWAHYYATGELGAVSRVLDVATPYMDFLEEYGDAPVTGYDGNDATPPPELADDPYQFMRFHTSRYALWTLLQHAGSHSAVADAFAALYSDLNDKAALLDPLGVGGESSDKALTAFGRQRLNLMHLLRPVLEQAAARAWKEGIGSGKWPASYALLEEGADGKAAPRLLGPDGRPSRLLLGDGEDGAGAASHHAAPAAAEPTPVVLEPAPVPSSAPAPAGVDAGNRDRRRVGLSTRSQRINTRG